MRAVRLASTRRWLLALAIGFPLLYGGFQWLSMEREYRQAIENAKADTVAMAAALAEHATNTVGEGDRVLLTLISDIERSGLTAAPADADALERLVRRHAALAGPQVSTVALVGPGGKVLTGGAVRGAEVDVSDRAYFKHHSQTASKGLLISPPLAGRLSGHSSMPLTRAIRHADGSLNMIVLLGIRLDFFKSFYRSLDRGDGRRALLAHRDGWLVMASPATEAYLRRTLAGSPLYKRLDSEKSGAYLVEQSAIDGSARVVGFDTTPGFPLVVCSTMLTDVVLAPWQRRVQETVLASLLTVAVMWTLAWLLWMRVKDMARAEKRLHQLAHHDTLTGLPNRGTFTDRLDHALRMADRRGTPLALLFVDVDRFKAVNDTLGHEAGDTVLRTLAERMRAVLRASDTVARLGGDEFVVLLEGEGDAQDGVLRVAGQLCAAMAEPIPVNGQLAEVSGSIGISVYPQDGTDADSLLRCADQAMYQAKSDGRNGWCRFGAQVPRAGECGGI